jgi:hypothetical protein
LGVGIANNSETLFGVANKFFIYNETDNAMRFVLDASGNITNSTWTATVIGMAYGGTGVSLSDPAANKLLGWDDTDNTNGYWTIGSGLSYDHTTHTLSATGGGGSGETNTASNLGGGLANYSTKVGVDLQFNSFAAADFNLASNVISIDYVNGQMATASVNGFMSTTNQTFAGDKTFENIFIADGKGEVIGNSSKLTVGVASEFQIQGTATADASMLLASFNTTAANDANLNFYRSKDAALGTATVVASGDELGSINWYGAQQTGTFSNAVIGARIYAKVSAAVTSGASGDMPTDLIISTTANASGTVTDRVKFTATSIEPTTDGAIGLGNTSGNTFSGVWLAAASEVNFGGGDVRFIQSTNSMLFTGAANGYKFDANIIPNANDGSALGTTALEFSDLFLASGAVVNFNNGDVTVTHSTDILTFAGAASGYKFDAAVLPNTSDGAALGSTTLMWSDAFFASGAVLNFNNGDVLITHSANTLAFTLASSGYTFDANVTVAANIIASGGGIAMTYDDGSNVSGLYLKNQAGSTGVLDSGGDLLYANSFRRSVCSF